MNNEIIESETSSDLRHNNDCSCGCHEHTMKQLMMKIKEYSFALNELNLYLDTHPDDSRAICLHNRYSNELKMLEDEYQKVYGPLTAKFPCNKWRWLEEPWPWERSDR